MPNPMKWQDTFTDFADRIINKGDSDVQKVKQHIESYRFVEASKILGTWMARINTDAGVKMEPEHVRAMQITLDNMQASSPRELAPQH